MNKQLLSVSLSILFSLITSSCYVSIERTVREPDEHSKERRERAEERREHSKEREEREERKEEKRERKEETRQERKRCLDECKGLTGKRRAYCNQKCKDEYRD